MQQPRDCHTVNKIQGSPEIVNSAP